MQFVTLQIPVNKLLTILFWNIYLKNDLSPTWKIHDGIFLNVHKKPKIQISINQFIKFLEKVIKEKACI